MSIFNSVPQLQNTLNALQGRGDAEALKNNKIQRKTNNVIADLQWAFAINLDKITSIKVIENGSTTKHRIENGTVLVDHTQTEPVKIQIQGEIANFRFKTIARQSTPKEGNSFKTLTSLAINFTKNMEQRIQDMTFTLNTASINISQKIQSLQGLSSSVANRNFGDALFNISALAGTQRRSTAILENLKFLRKTRRLLSYRSAEYGIFTNLFISQLEYDQDQFNKFGTVTVGITLEEIPMVEIAFLTTQNTINQAMSKVAPSFKNANTSTSAIQSIKSTIVKKPLTPTEQSKVNNSFNDIGGMSVPITLPF